MAYDLQIYIGFKKKLHMIEIFQYHLKYDFSMNKIEQKKKKMQILFLKNNFY